jgi:hypothetical protein
MPEGAQEYLKMGNGDLHSGHTIEDYLEFVLNKMRVTERKRLKEKAAKAAKAAQATKKKPVVASVGGDDLSDDDKEVEEEDEDAADEGNNGRVVSEMGNIVILQGSVLHPTH